MRDDPLDRPISALKKITENATKFRAKRSFLVAQMAEGAGLRSNRLWMVSLRAVLLALQIANISGAGLPD